MATESNPFPNEEGELESNTEELLAAAFALSLVNSTSVIKPSEFNPLISFNDLQQRFRNNFSEVLTDLNVTSKESIQIGINRFSREFGFSNLSIDYSDERFSIAIRNVFNNNMDFLLQTNQEMWSELRSIALENGWSDEELAKRLKRYYGLTPSHLRTVINMESALIADGVKKRKRDELVGNRIDRLLDWRINLSSVQISTGVVEGSKDESFGYLVDTAQIDRNEYEKRWVSIIDDVTSDTCISSHNTRAPIGGVFPNGMRHPPNLNVIHPCRSAITLAKKIL